MRYIKYLAHYNNEKHKKYIFRAISNIATSDSHSVPRNRRNITKLIADSGEQSKRNLYIRQNSTLDKYIVSGNIQSVMNSNKNFRKRMEYQ